MRMIISIGGAVAAVIMVSFWRFRRSAAQPDLGVISDHWIAQHRSSSHDSGN